MYPNKSESGQRRHFSSRDSRPWEEEGRREERREPQRNPTHGPYDKYIPDGPNRTERLSSREYSDSFNRQHSPNSKRDWRRKSPVRNRMPSPDRSVSEKRRRTVAEEDHYRYQHETEDTYRPSPEQFSQVQRNKDFKRTVSVEESYSRSRTLEDTRYSHQTDEFHYSQYQDEQSFKRSSEYYTDRDGRERSRERSQDYSPPTQRSGSFSRDREDFNDNRTRFSLNDSKRQAGEPSNRQQSPPPPPPPAPAPAASAAAGERKLSTGFQRFLDVLNMGVNVETLTRIVTQGSADVDNRPQSPPSPNTADRPWSVGSAHTQQSGLQNTQHWSETERADRQASPQPRSYSSNGKMSEEKSVGSGLYERKRFSPDCRSVSQSELVKTSLSPDEEHKHRQMQDVLQAIGINLEYEELGQMSNRIQERLYGKKQSDSAPNQKQETARRPAYVPRHRSRSSSGSTSSSSYQDYNKKSHSYSAPRDETDFPHIDEWATQQSGSVSSQHREKTERHAAIQVIPSIAHIKPEPPPAPVIPPPIVNCSRLPYAAHPLNVPPVMPSVFMPPFPSYPHIPPPNMFPPVVPRSGPVLPPNMNFPPPPFLNLPPIYPPQPVNTNTQKAKNLNRPRCLQVIPTNLAKDKQISNTD